MPACWVESSARLSWSGFALSAVVRLWLRLSVFTSAAGAARSDAFCKRHSTCLLGRFTTLKLQLAAQNAATNQERHGKREREMDRVVTSLLGELG